MQARETTINTSILFQNQLLATKFFVPIVSHPLISRPRLTALLQESLKRPLTLISAPAGFGKTTLLASLAQLWPANHPQLCWISLDEEDNDPQIFWTYVFTALQIQQPKRFTPLLKYLHSPQAPPLKFILTVLINLVAESTEHFVLILDDYHLIREQQVHTSLSYLIEHLPAHFHIILSTRADPPLPILQLRARRQILEVRPDQLRCTTQETRIFFQEVMDIQLPNEAIEQVTNRTEGWLVGLKLLALFLPECANPATVLEEVTGSQRYILDYLIEEVLRRQSPDMQTFLLSTCILQHLNASLCDAVLQQTGSQQMLERIEQANLFITSLDSRRQWYRYHALFAEALRCQMEQTHADLIPILHQRASIWYAEHNQITQGILHAFHAHQWQWAADLIERLPLLSFTWGAGEHDLVLLRQWLEQLPTEIVHSRPCLCLACARMLWHIASYPVLQGWLDAAETMLTASLSRTSPEQDSQLHQDQRNLLGEVIGTRAFLQSFQEDSQTVLPLCQQALALLSADNFIVRAHVTSSQPMAYYASTANDAVAAIESGLQAISLAQTARHTTLAISLTASTVIYMIGAGRLHEAQRLTQQAMQLAAQPGELVLPIGGWLSLFQGEILREWNKLDAARTLVEEAILQCQQTESLASLAFLLWGYSILLRVFLSRGELDAACSALQQVERIGLSMNQPLYICTCSFLTTIDQVRLWLACGDLGRATHWAKDLDIRERHGSPFAYEREEVACVRILLTQAQPDRALQRLEPVLQRATTGQRWGHVIEIRFLQALAHQMLHEEIQALDALSEAVRLAEPEGYIRSFVDEGASMAALLFRLREEQHTDRVIPYLDTLLAAFAQKSQVQKDQPKQVLGCTMDQPLLVPLSERELQVLQLLAHGASNQKIAQELLITVDTVKRHVSHIFSKLCVQNRVQAVIQSKNLGLLTEEI
ncbi:MAG TPA: LuxR C-terminal-related transcriptional regulator [Ktedonobacteraceae bacterium]